MSPPRTASTRINRTYPDLASGLARYRFAPPQPCENAFIADFIARSALKPVEDGYGWRFDPRLWRQFRPSDSWESLPAAQCPLAFANGALSSLTTPEVMARIREAVAPGTPFIEIPQAHHHVMVDRPLALASVLTTLFETWAPVAPRPLSPNRPLSEEP